MSRKEKPGTPKTAMRAPAVKRELFVERYARPLLGLILLLALGLRVAALTDLSRTIYVDFMLWDERAYHELAVRIANGTYADREVYAFAPLFAYLMAGVYYLFSPEIFNIRLLNIIFGVLACWVIYGIGARLGGRKIGLLACLVAALYKPFILYSIVPLKEAPTILLFTLTAFLLLMAIEKRDLIPSGLLGLAMGLLLNVRPNAVILIPILLLLIVWRRYQNGDGLRTVTAHFGLCLLGLWIAVVPFVIRNYMVAEKFAVTTSQSGFNLYLGNNLANPDPYYRPVPFASSSPFEQGIHFTIEASRRTGKTMSATEASDYWTKETFRQAIAEPRAFAGKVVQKTLALVNQFEACDHYDTGFISDFARFFKLPLFSFWFVFPLGMATLAFRLFDDRKARALGLILAVYAATLVIIFTNARYRVPMLAILIPYAALGGADLVETLRRRHFRRAGIFAAVVLAFTIVEFLPVRATDDRTAYFNTHAIILDSRGFENEAILYWRQSSEMKRPFSAFANLSLAHKYFQRGLIREGNGYLDLIPESSFAAAPKYEIKGDILIRQQKTGEAIQAYEHSLAINSGQRRALFKLIQIHQKTDPPKAAALEAQLKYIAGFYPAMPKTAETR
jgi:4-amino-4-deoxy-L-arabinose transferase-like glycosyltransferase